jgi:hypothetical protein
MKKRIIGILSHFLIATLVVSCSFSYNQSYGYNTKKNKYVKVRGCKTKIHNPRPNHIFMH